MGLKTARTVIGCSEESWTMSLCLIQQYRVNDECEYCKVLSLEMIMTVSKEEVPANFVPAAAVRRGGLALFILTGRKGHVGDLLSF